MKCCKDYEILPPRVDSVGRIGKVVWLSVKHSENCPKLVGPRSDEPLPGQMTIEFPNG